MKRKHVILAAAAALLALGGVAVMAMSSARAAPVVVELFQSQGCSSCPPADAIANDLAGRNDVLVLSFAVTYWDQLGWRDTYARDAFTRRQFAYAHGLGRSNVATPEMVINGHIDLVGNYRPAVERAVQGAARPMMLDANAEGVSIAAGGAPQGGADVWLVRYDPTLQHVAIQAGENNGRTLAHKNIVRELSLLGQWSGQAAHFTAPASPQPGLRTAYLVQGHEGGPILAAGVAP